MMDHGRFCCATKGNGGDTKALESPRYRNQFILGPYPIIELKGWQHLSVNGRLWLTVHPELKITRVTTDQRSLILLGFILDPMRPEATDHAILSQLLYTPSDNPRELVKATSGYGGRWILLATERDHAFLCLDALGLRQAFYTEPKLVGAVWVMSQPGLLKEIMDIPLDEGAVMYMDSYEFRIASEYRWPAAGTPYRELRHLLPNHYLDLETGNSQRHWPDQPLTHLSMGEGLDIVSAIMRGLIRAASHRFDLAMGLTAGLDSRVALAAAREFVDQIAFITVRQGRMKDDHPDVVVAARLLERLAIKHEVIKASATMGPDFSIAYKNNVFLAHDHYGPDAEAIARRFHRKKVVVTGSGAEVGECSYRNALPGGDLRMLTPVDLCSMQGMRPIPFVTSHFFDWLADVKQRYNVNLRDIFEWEQGHGNWLATTQLEMDMAWQDIFTPYNCRDLLVALLSVDEKYRRAPEYIFFKELIRTMWPELLSTPINPGKKKGRSFARQVKWTFRNMKWRLKNGLVRHPSKV